MPRTFATCPRCRGTAELVTDGAIVSVSLASVKRSSQHPTGIKRYESVRHVPFYACGTCEWCGEPSDLKGETRHAS